MSQFLVYKPIIEPYGTIFPFELSFDKFNNYISQYHRIKSWKGTTKSNLPTKAGSATAGYPGLYLVGFWIFAQMETPQPLGNVWSRLQYSYSDGISYSLICVHCLFSCQWKGEGSEKDLAYWEGSGSFIFITSYQIFIYGWDPPEPSLLLTEQFKLSLSSSEICSNLLILFTALRWTHSDKFTSLLYWEAQNSMKSADVASTMLVSL